MSSECEEMNHRCLFIVASVCTWLSGVAAAVTNPFGILTPGGTSAMSGLDLLPHLLQPPLTFSCLAPPLRCAGYLSQKAIGWIDHFTLSGLGLLERNEMTSR
jgi:hypothetical protein